MMIVLYRENFILFQKERLLKNGTGGFPMNDGMSWYSHWARDYENPPEEREEEEYPGLFAEGEDW